MEITRPGNKCKHHTLFDESHRCDIHAMAVARVQKQNNNSNEKKKLAKKGGRKEATLFLTHMDSANTSFHQQKIECQPCVLQDVRHEFEHSAMISRVFVFVM